MIVRPAQSRDAEIIADLLCELGYPATPAEVRDRLTRLTAFRHATALVAELDGHVVGVVTGHFFPSIHATPVAAWLTTLVVSSTARSQGVGRALATAIEEWAQQAGAVRLSVSSGMHRDRAHVFYENIGYERSGLRLTKTLV